MPNVEMLKVAGAALALGLLSLPAQAGAFLISGGSAGVAQFENQSAGGFGFPCAAAGCTPQVSTPGSTDPATLQVLASGLYDFTYYGAGDAANTNTFNFSTLTPIANHGSQIPYNQPGYWQQSLTLSANSFIDFTLHSSGGCTISAGNGPDGTCSYLLAYDTLDPKSVYIGFSDIEGKNGDCSNPQGAACPDYQDLVVKVTYASVPEPLTLSLFGAGLAGVAALRRRKKKA